jgi:hypothetical protein
VCYLNYPCQKLTAWRVVYKVNPCEQLYIPTDAAYHFNDEHVYEIYQEDELPTSFVVEPGAAIDSIVGDGVVVTILQKRKQQPVEKKRTRWSTLEWRRQLSTGRSYFGRPIAAENCGFPVMFLLAFSSSCGLSNSADGIRKKL